MRRTHTNIAVYIFSNHSHILEGSLLISTGVVENVRFVSMSEGCCWDPPSNTGGGEITGYRVSISYTTANGGLRFMHKTFGPNELCWELTLPAERPVTCEVRNWVSTAPHIEHCVYC